MTIEIVALAGLATIQDGGRPGHMHEGVPPGGPLVPELLARANSAVHNARGEAAVEVFGSLTIAADDELLVASDEGAARRLQPRERWTVSSDARRVSYLAVRGGIDVPRALGGRGTLLVARLGGYEGRLLKRGDRLRIGNAEACDSELPPGPDLASPVRVIPGPDLDRFDPSALDTLLQSSFELSPRSDRMGARLIGPTLARSGADTTLSAPMVRGAIQVPSSGEPIVLGPDHPTVGGYPVLATVLRADLGSLFARPLGARVTFLMR